MTRANTLISWALVIQFFFKTAFFGYDIRCWMMSLLSTFQCVDKGDYQDHLPTLLQKLLDPKARQSPNAELDEARISYAVRPYTCI